MFVSVSFTHQPGLLAGTRMPRWLAGGHMSSKGAEDYTMKWLEGTGVDVPVYE